MVEGPLSLGEDFERRRGRRAGVREGCQGRRCVHGEERAVAARALVSLEALWGVSVSIRVRRPRARVSESVGAYLFRGALEHPGELLLGVAVEAPLPGTLVRVCGLRSAYAVTYNLTRRVSHREPAPALREHRVDEPLAPVDGDRAFPHRQPHSTASRRTLGGCIRFPGDDLLELADKFAVCISPADDGDV